MLGAGSPGVASPGGVSGDGCAVAVEHLVGQPAHPSIHPSSQVAATATASDPVAAARLHRSNTSSRSYQVRAALCLSSAVVGGAPLTQ
jgi:hypothetical protein